MMYAQYCRIESRAGGCTASRRSMIRAARSMVNPYGKTRECRSSRQAWLRDMLSMHRDAELQFMAVTSGRRLK